MSLMRRAAVLFAGAVIALVFGCEVIVPADVPDFTCGSVSATACPEGLVCDVLSGKCVPPVSDDEGGPGDDGGGDGDSKADGKDGSESGGPLDLGQPCRFDVECKSKLCGTSTLLTTTFTGQGPICTQTCCTSADCPSAFICFNGGTGGGYCVPAAKAQRTPPATGGKSPGSTCLGPSECRSGLCSNGHCVDTCCVSSDCASGTMCGVGTVSTPPPGHDEWTCIVFNGTDRNAGTQCTDNIQCKVNNCVGQKNNATCPQCPVCTPSCCSSNDCTAWAAVAAPQGGTCAYGLSGSDQLKWCFPVDMTRAPIGTTCSSNFDCQSAYCDPELKKCSQVCCRDTDCGVGNVCKPSAVNTPFLRCVPGSR